MATEVAPLSVFAVTEGKVFDYAHSTATNDRWFRGFGVMASLDADAEVNLTFRAPNPLPAGTGKLRLWPMSGETSGNAKVNPKWKSVAVEETLDVTDGNLNAEGTTTISWAAGDADVFKEADVTLDADTLVAGQFVLINLVMETTGWTLAGKSLWIPMLVWE